MPVGSGTMLGYRLMPYEPRSAEVATTWPLIALAAQKRHLSLYVCAVVDAEELGALVRDAVAATDDGANGYTGT